PGPRGTTDRPGRCDVAHLPGHQGRPLSRGAGVAEAGAVGSVDLSRRRRQDGQRDAARDRAVTAVAASAPLAASTATVPLAAAAAPGTQAPAAAPDTLCAHCGLPAPAGRHFCCPGCAAAYATIEGLGLGRYYASRVLDPAQRPPRPEAEPRWDLARHVVTQPDGTHALTLAIDGLQCGACVWLIEQVLAREPDVTQGRVNMTTRRLHLAWRGGAERAAALVGRIEALGYRLVPFDATLLGQMQDATGAALLRALGRRLRRGQRDADLDRRLGRA